MSAVDGLFWKQEDVGSIPTSLTLSFVICWPCLILVIIFDCLSEERSSILRKVAKMNLTLRSTNGEVNSLSSCRDGIMPHTEYQDLWKGSQQG